MTEYNNTQLISELESIAWDLYTQQDYIKSIEIYKKIIKLEPDNYNAYHMLGFVCNMAAKFEEAIFMYDKAIELYSDNADDYFNRGYCKLFMKYYEIAILDFNKCIKLCSEKHPVTFYREIAKLFVNKDEELKDLYLSIDKVDYNYFELLLDSELSEIRNRLLYLLDELVNTKPNLKTDIRLLIEKLRLQ